MSSNGAWFQTKSDSTVTVRFSNENEQQVPRFAVAYWSIKGLAAPLRMMLCAAKEDFTCYMYDLNEDDSTGGWTSGYFADKAQNLLKHNPFMNLPYIVDQKEKLVLSQSNACFQYLAEQLGMMGKSTSEHAICVQLLCELLDVRNIMVKFTYGSDVDAAEATVQAPKKHFAKFDHHLQNNKDAGKKQCFTNGESFTAPDFHLFEMVEQYDHLCKAHGLEDYLADFPHVRAFYEEFAQLE